MLREELDVRAPDGRRLMAELAGPEDGRLVIFHGGTPGSRHLPGWWYEAGASRGLRHVSYSRPGYPGSDRMPGRAVVDCVGDTVAFADALGADTFYLFGSSGGGPHALACAALLPDRVIAAVSVSGVGSPLAEDLDWTEGMCQENLDELVALRGGDAELERFIERGAAELRKIDTPEKLRANLGDSHCQADRDVLVGTALKVHASAGMLAVSDGIWGWFDDEKALWGSDWGFDLGSIEVPTSLWQGTADRMVPAGHGRWFAGQIPQAKFHLLPEEGHVSLLERHYGEILDELIAGAA
jgi:pimeloyl-ACP methyl ester carboxylesterase